MIDKINPVPPGQPVPAICPFAPLLSSLPDPLSSLSDPPGVRAMLKVPQKMPKLIGFNPSDCDLSHVRPMVAEACAIISPAITSIGGFHKEVLDNLPDFVESMITGDDPDDVVERFNDEVPARDVKGKTIDWSKIAGVVLPILSKFITDLLTPKAGAAAKSRGKSRGKK